MDRSRTNVERHEKVDILGDGSKLGLVLEHLYTSKISIISRIG